MLPRPEPQRPALCGIHNVRLVLPDGVVSGSWVTFGPAGVTEIGRGEPPAEADSENGDDRYLAPGFIDLHVHGGAGADFLDGTHDAFLRIGDFHLQSGTTALCPTLATASYIRINQAYQAWESARTKATSRLLPLHLEGPHLNRAKAGAQDPQEMHPATETEIGWLLERANGISQITLAPELPGALDLVSRARRAGIRLSAGHSEARGPELQAARSRGLSKVTHLYNAMTSAAKMGIFRDGGAVEYALTDEAIGCELIADGVHASPTLLKLAYRAKGPDGIALISDALSGTGLPIGSTFNLGATRCAVDRGYCRLADGTALAGSCTRLIDQVKIMVKTVGVPLHDAVAMAATTPARLIGLDHQLGSIARGKQADFVMFDDNFAVGAVWVGGAKVVG